ATPGIALGGTRLLVALLAGQNVGLVRAVRAALLFARLRRLGHAALVPLAPVRGGGAGQRPVALGQAGQPVAVSAFLGAAQLPRPQVQAGAGAEGDHGGGEREPRRAGATQGTEHARAQQQYAG